MRILVTGGTGHLGRAVVSGLQRDGHDVRILARRPGGNPDVEWTIGDLATGAGVREAVVGMEAVVHAATHSPAAQRGRFTLGDMLSSPDDVDVKGTAMLVDAAEQNGIEQFVHVSIVGLQHVRRMGYARRKLEAEEIVMRSGLPWSIVRATGFYWLLARMFDTMLGHRMLALPTRVRMAPVDSDEFAEFIVEGIADGRPGEREDFAGPQTLTMIELMRQYLDARGTDRRIRHAPLPARVQEALTASSTSATGARLGTATWAQWLRRPAAATGAPLAQGERQA